MIFVAGIQIISNVVGASTLLSSTILFLVGNQSLLSIIGAHLLFNMKEAGEKGLNEGTSCGSKSTVSEIDFADAPQVATDNALEDTLHGETIEMVEIA